ncbi:MAG TPA: PSD1 and planctomycete cytochrome C domain-containing protein [Verrucomicrobiae bacterium]|nr:PSD1 and planctomycete cytochrome C domain-containing protein [Verrucomicrobiae bacterium]
MKHQLGISCPRATGFPWSLRPLRICLVIFASAAASAAGLVDVSKLPPPANRPVDFAREIRPIFENSCTSCHGAEKQKSSYRLDARASALKGGETYHPAIQPGRSAESPLIHLVAGLVPETKMPAKGDPLTAEQIGLLRAWIDQGASWPEDGQAQVDPIRSHWAFRPVTRPAVPVRQPPTAAAGPANQIHNAIDAFITAKLADKQLTLSAEADRVTLIRRLYAVMLGMPPTPEEVAVFRADRDPDAFERLVDRVLDDPRYGERWGRHWLDVIRFAESNGFETNRERPNAWRFRDYVIAAFNRDKPYNRFVREQLAGDVLGEDVATGFLVGGAVDIVGSPDPVLTAQQRADELDDMVSTTGTAFLGLTVGCARCHSHKFDPIEHREYYALSALFNGVRHGERALPASPEQKMEVAALDVRIRELEQELSPFLVKAEDAKTATNRPAGRLRPAVNSQQNEEVFTPVQARLVRFTVVGTSSSEPCLDELEVWSDGRNVALATNGTKATASGTLPGYEIHKLAHVNDGQFGNSHSWISDEGGRGWVQLEFARPERIERIVWGRDREGKFTDRVATNYKIEAAREPGLWQELASSADREPFTGKVQKPAAPLYRFAGLPGAEAAQGQRWVAELERARNQRETAARTPMVYAGTFSQPGPTYRLHRGDPMQKREPVAPGTLAVFNPLTLATNAAESQRRLELANWIASPTNPLTARVLVNRVWQYQFGVGLVDTPNDFGRNGARPTHPELLDWLASEFVAQGWSIKALQKQILTSATWRQSSAPRPDALKVDAASRLLWRFPPRRLEAEAIRDSILAVSGNLTRTAGGPSFFLHNVDRENVYHYHPKEMFTSAETRRMVYAFKVRMEQDGVFGAFDCPDGSLVMPRRSLSTTPLQALNLLNSGFILQQAEIFSERLRQEAGPDIPAEIQRGWQLAFGRRPSAPETVASARLVEQHGLPALCRALLNANELLFIP